eukprot:RCo029938
MASHRFGGIVAAGEVSSGGVKPLPLDPFVALNEIPGRIPSPGKALGASTGSAGVGGTVSPLSKGSLGGSRSRCAAPVVQWREHSVERAQHQVSSTAHLMSWYLENRHRPKPTHRPGCRPPQRRRLPELSALVAEIFPKYPMPLNFLQEQQRCITRHPPVLRNEVRPPSAPAEDEVPCEEAPR